MVTRRPRLLDLFCGAGGAAMGYHRAGFDVTGVDIEPRHRYPFMDLIQDDAFAVLADWSFVSEFDAVHASPPCPHYSVTRHLWKRDHPALIEPVRDFLEALDVPYVIENVVGAPLRDPVTLCGSMFGLGLGDAVLRRHRLFETNFPSPPPRPDDCKGRPVVGVYGTGGAWKRTAPGGGGTKVSGEDAATALGIDWTSHTASLAQAIPPAYTEHIGRHLMPLMTP